MQAITRDDQDHEHCTVTGLFCQLALFAFVKLWKDLRGGDPGEFLVHRTILDGLSGRQHVVVHCGSQDPPTFSRCVDPLDSLALLRHSFERGYAFRHQTMFYSSGTTSEHAVQGEIVSQM